MRIFSNITETINKSRIAVKVLSTFDARRNSEFKEEDFGLLLSKHQASSNDDILLDDSEPNQFCNVNAGVLPVYKTEASRVKELREKGRMLGANEYYVDAYLTIADLSNAIANGEPVRYKNLDDLSTIYEVISSYLASIEQNHGRIKDINSPVLDNLQNYFFHIQDLLTKYRPSYFNSIAAASTVDKVIYGGLPCS